MQGLGSVLTGARGDLGAMCAGPGDACMHAGSHVDDVVRMRSNIGPAGCAGMGPCLACRTTSPRRVKVLEKVLALVLVAYFSSWDVWYNSQSCHWIWSEEYAVSGH